MKKLSLIAVLLLLFLWLRGVELFFTRSSFFELKEFSIKGNEDLRWDEVFKLTGLRLKRNIFQVDLKDIKKKIEKDQRVKTVDVHRSLPAKICIKVEEKKPDLLINTSPSPRLYGISSEGELIPLKKGRSYDLPLINGVRAINFKPYTRIEDAEIDKALSFYNIIKQEDPRFFEKVSEINLKDEDNLVVIMVKTGSKIFWGAGDFQKKFKRFVWLNTASAPEEFFCLDFRFKDLVIYNGVKKSL